MKLKKVTIIGTGFMGGSLALALRKKSLALSVWGLARSKEKAKKIRRLKIFDMVTSDITNAIMGADLVVLATPINSIIQYLKILSGSLDKRTIVTDIGSTKTQIVKVARRQLKNNFVGSHPLCGSEKTGAKNACGSLFKGSLCIITPIKKNRGYKMVRSMWRALGSEVVTLNELSHDKALAYTSALPHVLSFSLTKSIEPVFFKFTAGSFKDATRVSASEARIWTDIFLSNSKCINEATQTFLKNIKRLLTLINKKDRAKLLSFLKKINHKYNSLIAP